MFKQEQMTLTFRELTVFEQRALYKLLNIPFTRSFVHSFIKGKVEKNVWRVISALSAVQCLSEVSSLVWFRRYNLGQFKDSILILGHYFIL